MVETIRVFYILFSLWGLVMLGALINALLKVRKNEGTIRKFYIQASIFSGVFLFSTLISLSLLLIGYTLAGAISFFVVFFLAMIYSLITFKSTFKAQRVINAKIIEESGKRPLKWTDIFTHVGWVQLTLHFGLWRAGVIIFIIDFTLLFAMFFILNQFLFNRPLTEMMGDVFLLAIIGTAFFVYSMKKI